MANKRNFKKALESLTAAIADEMMISYYNEKEADRDKISKAIAKVITGMEKAKSTAAQMFGKGVKEFQNLAEYNKAKTEFTRENYKKAIAEYNDALSDALKEYNEGMPKKN